jgi:hypothetical protein
VPLHRPLVVAAWEIAIHGRQHSNTAEIRDDAGEVLARSTGVFVAIDPHRMFARYLRNANGG